MIYDVPPELRIKRLVERWKLSGVRREELMYLVNALARDRDLAREAAREASDLRIHLKDRDAHIRNLEAELMPHLRAGTAEQPSLEVG